MNESSDMVAAYEKAMYAEQVVAMEAAMVEELTPKQFHPTNNLPTTPVLPETLVKEVTNKLESFNITVSDKIPTLIEEICKVFNQCVLLNENKEKAQTLILSPNTGTAKSLTAQLYASLLLGYKSLIVVPRVDDALEYCKNINEWSGNENKARTVYKVSDANEDNILRIEKNEISEYDCIVITHAMFKISNKNNDRNILYNMLKKTPPSIIIVDERLKMEDTSIISYENIVDLLYFFEKAQLKTQHKFKLTLERLNKIKELIEELDYKAKKENKNIIRKEKIKALGNYVLQDAQQKIEVEDLMEENKSILELLTTLITASISNNSNEYFSNNILNTLLAIDYIISSDFYFNKNGNMLQIISTKNIYQDIGSYVVLDATAKINKIYDVSTYSNPNLIKHYETTSPNSYENFTIHKCKGFAQGKTSIYINLKKPKQKQEAKKYLKIANNILKDEHDKLLIVTFKDFREIIESQLNGSKSESGVAENDKRIRFTHWGNHVGKNEWSNCNKVLIIGWNHFPSNQSLINYINAVGDNTKAEIGLSASTLKDFENTQLVDDLIQAMMRCSARKTMTSDGNCYPSDAYIFYPDNAKGKEILEKVTSQFKGVQTIEVQMEDLLESSECEGQQPSLLLNKRIRKNTKNIEIIISYLNNEKDLGRKAVLCSVIKKEIDELGDSVFYRTLDNEEFKESLQKKGYRIVMHDKRSKKILL